MNNENPINDSWPISEEKDTQLIFEKSAPGKRGFSLPACDVPDMPLSELAPESFLRKYDAMLPEVSESEAVRHYTALSIKNYGVDTGFYPLGSCTMKYNPKVHEDIAEMPGFAMIHPRLDDNLAQGCLEIIYQTGRLLSEITGMDEFSMQPAAGAHGELAALMMIKEWHLSRGGRDRKKILVPDSAHGTNPASAAMAGFEIVEVKSDASGLIDIETLRAAAGNDTAGLMLTNPNTLGLFEENILQIADIVHEAGGLLYYDGANANAILGITRPGDMGFDLMHLNLHKTFSAPHGGGGPGAGPIGVRKQLSEFLPIPVIEYDNGIYRRNYDRPNSIGSIKTFCGNFLVILRAYAYIMSLGAEGLRKVSEAAVLNANYLLSKLREYYFIPYDKTCLHEFVLSAGKQKDLYDISAADIAKRLIDKGIHPPTVYFPLIVREAMMIEPTETESRETLDSFILMMKEIAAEAEESPHLLKSAPHYTPVGRLDEVAAARNPILKWTQ